MSAPEPTPRTPSTAISAEDGSTSRSALSEVRRREVRRSVAVLGDRVLVAPPEDADRKSKGGILIPATARSMDRKGLWGETIGIGPNVRHIDVGDEVLYLPDDAIEVDVQGDAYLIVRERDVHAAASVRRDGETGLYL